MIDFGNHYYVAQIWALSLGTCCPPREQRLLISCSPIPHHVIPEGPLGEHGRNRPKTFFIPIFRYFSETIIFRYCR